MLHNRINSEELRRRMEASDEARVTFSFYRYLRIADPSAFRDMLYVLLAAHETYGRVYVAQEGINGQVSVPAARLDAVREAVYGVHGLDGMRLNIAVDDDGKSFYKLKIKVRPKIVADGLDDDTFDPADRGTHVDAAAFNALTDNPDTIVVDMRNRYETEVGHFLDAVLPEADTFREALPEAERLLEDKKDKPVVMYCTGGIRCEKASAWLRHQGFEQVYQLDGGIIEYARQVREQGLPNKFRGKNFVFDERLGERISDEVISTCHQCDQPSDTHVNCANDRCHILFIQCPACAEAMEHTCSTECRDFMRLAPEVREREASNHTFNGTRAGTKRYRGLRGRE